MSNSPRVQEWNDIQKRLREFDRRPLRVAIQWLRDLGKKDKEIAERLNFTTQAVKIQFPKRSEVTTPNNETAK